MRGHGHRRQAARRRRAPTRESARAGEGGGGDAAAALPPAPVATGGGCAVSTREQKGEREKEWLGFRGEPASTGFCCAEIGARPSDSIQWSGAAAGRAGQKRPRRGRDTGRFPGPGPGCGLGAGARRRARGPRAASGRGPHEQYRNAIFLIYFRSYLNKNLDEFV